ncbi:ankyrin repeat domain-containing protein, partial [Halorubrum sp. Atlit-28R]|uniref:ankyrin repeat domain-containing protein n=1 Tax=Halorubrum sp. Atlit-28R TaxID=2282129 RepID=UPI000F25450F
PLVIASNAGHEEIVRALINAGAQVDLSCGGDDYKRSALHDAALLNRFECVRLLLAAGANPNVRCTENSTPLHNAIRVAECSDVVELLLAGGAEVDPVDSDGLTPLLYGLSYDCSCSAIDALIKAGADVNFRSPHKVAPIHEAKNFEMMEKLILAGADVNAQDENGRTVL